jgi:hypothetical protein
MLRGQFARICAPRTAYTSWLLQPHHCPCFHASRFLLQDETYKDVHPAEQQSAPDPTDYIDPLSLRNSLENVRAANRAGLIRKTQEDGQFQRVILPKTIRTPSETDGEEYDPLQDEFEPHHSVEGISHVQDEAGRNQPLRGVWKARKNPQPRFSWPWLFYTEQLAQPTTGLFALAFEIEQFKSYMTPTKDEERIAQELTTELRILITSKSPDTGVETIGSRATGIAGPLSDIDLNLLSRGKRLDDFMDRPQALKNLKLLKVSMARTKEVQNVKLLARAKIPIITALHAPTGLELQIQQTAGAYNSSTYVKMFLREHPQLHHLFLVLRQILVMRGLGDGSRQGLSSYPLLNMIVAWLKLEAQDGTDIGTQLVSFLGWFSSLDLAQVGITVQPPQLLPKSKPKGDQAEQAEEADNAVELAPRHPGFSYAMYLRDPADPSNDLGRACAMIKHIQATFLQAKVDIEKAMAEWTTGGLEVRNRPLLRCLVGDYTTFEVDRASLRQAQVGKLETAAHRAASSIRREQRAGSTDDGYVDIIPAHW